jgi:hypothetical protein
MNVVPLFWGLGKGIHGIVTYLQTWTGAPYSLWELDASLSPVLIAFLVVGTIYQTIKLIKSKPFFTWVRVIPFILLILGIWLNLEFIMARGYIYPLLRELPILNSLHVNVRFTAAFMFPLALLGAFFHERISSRWKFLRESAVFLTFVALTLAGVMSYFAYTKDIQSRHFDFLTSLETYNRVQAGETFPIEQIIDISDGDSFLNNASNTRPYEPLFGYALEHFSPETVPGAVTDIRDGKYNMTNPAGYVFPAENHVRAFELISIDEADKLMQFTQRYQPDWKRSLPQNILNITSLLSFVVLGGVLLIFPAYRTWKRRHSERRKPAG